MVWRFLFSVPAFFTLVVVTAAMDKEGPSLKDDYKTLLKAEHWGKDVRVDKAELKFKDKDFPVLEMTFTELIPEGKGLAPGESFKVSAKLEEKDGKHVLVIDGKAIAYHFEKDESFLVLDGQFDHEKKVIKLTGKWGQASSKK